MKLRLRLRAERLCCFLHAVCDSHLTNAPVVTLQGENNARKLAEAEELEGKARELVKDFQANATTRARGLNVSSVQF